MQRIADRESQLTEDLRDLLALTKPHIVLMSTLTAAGGAALALAHAPVARSSVALWLSMIAVALLVAGAGALNMVLERDLDRRMERTRDRPLAARRIRPRSGWILGAGCVGLPSSGSSCWPTPGRRASAPWGSSSTWPSTRP